MCLDEHRGSRNQSRSEQLECNVAQAVAHEVPRRPSAAVHGRPARAASEELHARKIDVFRGIPATTARTQPLDNSQCFPILRHVLREGVAKLNKQASKRQQPPGGKKKRSK
ncbi:MAG: hypothetical protein ACK559_32265, partial [bacterium]